MGGQQPLGPEVAMQIRLGLDRLRARNGFHEFEGLCLAFANARLGGHFVPATGPVSAGGDYGRDFTSHLRMVQNREITFVDEVVAICTTQVERVVDKIRSDLRKVTADRPVKAVFAFLTTDMPIGHIERLKHEAESDYGIRLEIFDGNRLAHSMATADFASIAYRWLHLDPRSLSGAVRATDEARQWVMEVMPDSFRPDLHDYLEAVLEAGRRHPWRFVDQLPDLRALYQPQSLEAPDGSSCVWQQAVERSQCLVISGPAGAGKSSLLQYVAASLADRWLRRQPQPWLPVLVRAHDLAEGKPLIQALRDGVEHVLKSLLHRPLEVDFFDHEPPTEQWLVLVDGLDEVRDRDQRAEVLQAAEHAARRDSMRFVITSRPGVWNTDTATFTHYTLRPLLDVDLRSLVTRWLERCGRASKDVELWAHKMINLLGRSGWQPTPLIAAMICVLADTDADQPEPTSLDGIYSAFVDRLVTRLTRVDEPAIDNVQNQIHTLLEEAASQRLFSDPDARLLDLVIASATTNGITPPAPLAADWHQTVEDVLLRSGLITKQGKELEFLHASFEEYYVARAFPNWTPAGIVGALADQEDSFYTKTDLVLANLSLLELLLARTDDVDTAVAALVTAYPSAVQTLVEHFEHHDLGERTADALTTIAADRHELLDVRAKAATALDDLNPGNGVPYRLALSIDLDLDDSDRLDIISGLIRHGGEAAAAAKWLTFETLEDTFDDGWKYQAGPIVSVHVSDDDYAHGLRLIATNTFLTNRLRIAACCDLVEHDPEQAYRLLRKVTKTRWLALELVDSRNAWAPTLIERFVLDDTVVLTDRIQAIKWLENEDPRQAQDLYESLAQSASLTDEKHNAVSSAEEHLYDN